MKTTANRRIVILSDLESPYFEQSILVLKENVVKEEEQILNEARSIVDKYIKRCERGSILTHTGKKRISGSLFPLLGGAAVGAAAMYLVSLL